MTPTPPIVDRETWKAQVLELRAREKAHTREGAAIAAARRRLPMVEVDATTPLLGAAGTVSLLDAFEGRTQLFVSYQMWHAGCSAANQCEGCSFNASEIPELSYLHSRGVTLAAFCPDPYGESRRYHDFMGWEMPWYSVPEESQERLIVGRHFGMKVCYLRDGDRVFETYWTTGRGCEHMGSTYALLDMTVYGRQEWWEDSPEGWPKPFGRKGGAFRLLEDGSPSSAENKGRPIRQWSRLAAGYSDDLSSTAEDKQGCCQ
ncbi:DUF899-domain-containing protein [Thozetella sp. PMI_491]|nr:DUF899-domain-containing protein [Thozetella sp. PMI_491]